MNKFSKCFALAIFLVGFCKANELKENFFSNPKIIFSEEIAELLNSQSLDMCWHFKENDSFHFISNNDSVYFEIILNEIPNGFESIKNLFIEKTLKSDDKKKKYYIFSFEWKNDVKCIVNCPRKHNNNSGSNAFSYILEKRRVFESASPQLIYENELISIICNKNILFYTGAGLSIASGVPSMNELEDLFGFKDKDECLFSLKSAVEEPEIFVKKIINFHNACFFNSPTKAHNALKKLAIFKNTRIVTENLDTLHEQSGISPYRINSEKLKKEVEISEIKNIDYVICIGLSYDDRGFLGWYKKINPNGKIISIDLKNPTYLGNEDFIIHEDLQDLLPSLADRILNND